MLLAPFLLQAVQPAVAFAPPLGVPIRVVTERSQGEGAARTVYRMERLIRFSRDGAGYRAEVVLLVGEADASGPASAMFEAAFARLAGRTMTFHLDGAGKLIGVDDREALWDELCRGVVALVLARANRSKAMLESTATALAAPFRAFPVERQQAVLGSLVAPLAVENADEAPGSVRPVRLPGTSPFGGQVMLDGTRKVERSGSLLRSVTRAAADVALPARADAPARAGHVELEVSRDMDAATGMLAAGVETVRTSIEGVPQPDRVTTVRVEIAPASAWPK